MKTLRDSVELLRFLFTDDIEPDERARELIAKAGPEYLRAVTRALEAVDPWTRDAIQEALDTAATAAGLSRTKAWQPVRAAATGSTVSPPLPESLELLGREQTVRRLRAASA
jgi:glutamyl-tRNA synthetase